jgi:hypothetical protein
VDFVAALWREEQLEYKRLHHPAAEGVPAYLAFFYVVD